MNGCLAHHVGPSALMTVDFCLGPSAPGEITEVNPGPWLLQRGGENRFLEKTIAAVGYAESSGRGIVERSAGGGYTAVGTDSEVPFAECPAVKKSSVCFSVSRSQRYRHASLPRLRPFPQVASAPCRERSGLLEPLITF